MSQTKHSRQVKGQTLLETNVLQTAAVWHQTPPPSTSHTHTHTLAPELKRHYFIHHEPSSLLSHRPPLSHTTLCFWGWVFFFFPNGGVGGRPGAVTVLSSCSSFSFLSLFFFEDVFCSFFFSCFVFFPSFLIRNIIAHHFHQSVTSSSFLVCLMQTTLL